MQWFDKICHLQTLAYIRFHSDVLTRFSPLCTSSLQINGRRRQGRLRRGWWWRWRRLFPFPALLMTVGLFRRMMVLGLLLFAKWVELLSSWVIRMVFENVSLEPVTSRERGLATLTPIRTLSCVEKHVAHQGTFVAKTQGTVFTEVVLFVSMNL